MGLIAEPSSHSLPEQIRFKRAWINIPESETLTIVESTISHLHAHLDSHLDKAKNLLHDWQENYTIQSSLLLEYIRGTQTSKSFPGFPGFPDSWLVFIKNLTFSLAKNKLERSFLWMFESPRVKTLKKNYFLLVKGKFKKEFECSFVNFPSFPSFSWLLVGKTGKTGKTEKTQKEVWVPLICGSKCGSFNWEIIISDLSF